MKNNIKRWAWVTMSVSALVGGFLLFSGGHSIIGVIIAILGAALVIVGEKKAV
jgi:hypothetical protein